MPVSTVRRTAALSRERAWQTWSTLAPDPRFGCAAGWSTACHEWQRSSDQRLRQRVLEQLILDEHELARWLARRPDRAGLVEAHAHVTTSRAGVEHESLHRTLAPSALRTQPVAATTRGGVTTVFADADDLPRVLDEVAATYDGLPAHPFVRSAWLSQAIGAVHPFVDANGGTARFLSSIELARAWLPPLVLTQLQRNTTYAEAIVQDQDLAPLSLVVHDVVQQELARLLCMDAPPAEWTRQSRAYADAWTARTEIAWKAAASLGIEARDDGAIGARFARRGYRIGHDARLTSWSTPTPTPMQLELAIWPARTVESVWTLASVSASIGDTGSLGPVLSEPVATIFVVAPEEAEAEVNARFELWLATRLDQTVRGISAWM